MAVGLSLGVSAAYQHPLGACRCEEGRLEEVRMRDSKWSSRLRISEILKQKPLNPKPYAKVLCLALHVTVISCMEMGTHRKELRIEGSLESRLPSFRSLRL